MNTLIALLLGLLLDAVIDHHTPMPIYGTAKQWRAFPWVGSYLDFVGDCLNASSLIKRTLGLLIVLLPLPTLAAILWAVLSMTLNWAAIIFEAIVLMFCLLPLDKSLSPDPQVVEFTEQVSSATNETFTGRFVVLFWFAILGAFGAVLFRILNFLVQSLTSEESNFSVTAKGLHHALSWLPARITAYLFALTGSFVATYDRFSEHLLNFEMANEIVLKDCVLAALEGSPSSVQALESLLMRTGWAWVILLAIVLLC
ncbi:MAG: hypothetical protein CMF48_05675 [Legionellales bacterium]|nr:hypothetical protein [Legionellales bacterium]|tara:strand:- start:342 stop:1109 length:768 start_codon:yes stop_codon:yes gene_type:complete